MNIQGSSGGAKIRFEYSWAITREIDRINRQSQVKVPLDSRILKLRGLAEPFLSEEDEASEEFLEAWEKTLTDDDEYSYSTPAEVRWRQFRILVKLFHRKGVFMEQSIPFERLAYQEM